MKFRLPSPCLSSFAVLAACLVAPLTGVAAAYSGSASEPFNYAAGNLIGQNGGSGFSGAWARSAAGTFIDPTVSAGGLAGGDPTGSAVFTGSGASGSTGTASLAFRALPATVDTGTVYLGFQMERLTDSQRTLVMGLYLGGTSGTTERLAIGQVGFISGTTQTGTAGNIGLLFGNSTAAANRFATGIGLDTGSVFRLVLRIDYNASGNDEVRLYVNPTSGNEPAVANLDVTAFEVGSFNNLRPFAGGSSGSFGPSSGAFDDLRVGTTFASVVPEPSAFAAVVLGAVLLAGTWRLRAARRSQAAL